MNIPLEDDFADVLNKAASGLGYNPMGLCRLTGLDPIRITNVLEGKFESGTVMGLSTALKLHPPSVFQLATRAWYPGPVSLNGLAAFNTPFPIQGYEEMTVNSYLVWEPSSRVAAAFDTGSNVDAMLETIRMNDLRLRSIFITHKHEDHIQALPYLMEATGCHNVYANELEPVPGATLFNPGDYLSVGMLGVETCLTSGHSPGGTTYVISGLDLPVAIVGDALFCSSMGGAMNDFTNALECIKREIFSLPDETIICPGHGPMTTVGEEREHNPFFAGGEII